MTEYLSVFKKESSYYGPERSSKHLFDACMYGGAKVWGVLGYIILN